MTTDGGLRPLFKKHLPPGSDLQPVETWSTGQGVPDLNYCIAGAEGWVELKGTATNKVIITPQQVAWAERRLRAGGRVFLTVRKQHAGGPRRGAVVDELWLFPGNLTRAVAQHGLNHERAPPLYRGAGGPGSWDWQAIAQFLRR